MHLDIFSKLSIRSGTDSRGFLVSLLSSLELFQDVKVSTGGENEDESSSVV